MIQIKCDRCLNVLYTTDMINRIDDSGPQYINFNIRVGDGKYVRRSLCRDCLYLFFKNFLEEDPDDILHDGENSCSNCKFWRLDANDENRRCKYCHDQDEWQADKSESEV